MKNISQKKVALRELIVPEDISIKSALLKLNHAATGTLFVVNSSDIISGIITDGDIRRALLKGTSLEDRVASAMNKKFVAAKNKEVTDDFLQNLDQKISYLPILNNKNQIIDYLSFVFKSRIPISQPKIGELESIYVNECLSTNWISSQGRFVTEFERKFAEFCDVEYAAATSSGTTALHLALECLDISIADEVIVPSLTFIATANAVKYAGATPIFVDSEYNTWNIDPEKIKSAITDKTKAIIPVHLFGQPAQMDEIMEIAQDHGLFVIEDAAQAHGALYKNRKIGRIGNISCFSFFGNKIITTGEGGMVLSNNKELIKKAKILRDHGMSPEKKYWHPVIGFNYRMTNLQAAIGCAQVEKIDNIFDSKNKTFQLYNERLKDSGLILPPRNNWSKNVHWMYSILINGNKNEKSRDEILVKMEDRGIEGRPFFVPIHLMPPYNTGQTLPVAQYLSNTGICLPSYVGITETEIDFICDVLLDLLK